MVIALLIFYPFSFNEKTQGRPLTTPMSLSLKSEQLAHLRRAAVAAVILAIFSEWGGLRSQFFSSSRQENFAKVMKKE
jgi:hypothetical protein